VRYGVHNDLAQSLWRHRRYVTAPQAANHHAEPRVPFHESDGLLDR
jgi:hypothetical protein